mgnify:CR=1 FL=1
MLNMCYILISLLCIPPDPVPETLQYLRINGQAFEMTWAQSAPTIDSVLDSYEDRQNGRCVSCLLPVRSLEFLGLESR